MLKVLVTLSVHQSCANWVSGVTAVTEMLVLAGTQKLKFLQCFVIEILLLKILQQSSKEKDFFLCKYTANHGIIPI